MYLDSPSRVWKYPNRLNNLYIRNTTYPGGAGAGTDQGFSTNVNEGLYTVGPGCAYDELIFNVYDSVTFQPWTNDYSGPTGLYGSIRSTCGPNRGYNFEYAMGSSATRKQAMDFLDLLPPSLDLATARPYEYERALLDGITQTEGIQGLAFNVGQTLRVANTVREASVRR